MTVSPTDLVEALLSEQLDHRLRPAECLRGRNQRDDQPCLIYLRCHLFGWRKAPGLRPAECLRMRRADKRACRQFLGSADAWSTAHQHLLHDGGQSGERNVLQP